MRWAETTTMDATSVDSPSVAEIFLQVPATVAVVTTGVGGRPIGMTVSSFCSVSASPPLLLVCLSQQSRTGRAIAAATTFGLNVLEAADAEVASRFAAPLDAASRFEGVDWRWDGDIPRLTGARLSVRCRVHQVLAGGDHLLVLGEPQRLVSSPGLPLLRHGRGYRSLT